MMTNLAITQRKYKNWPSKKKNNYSTPKAEKLLFAPIDSLNVDCLKKIVSYSCQNPVISLYLVIKKNNISDTEKVKTVFNSLKSRFLRENKSYLATLNNSAKQTLNSDLEQIANLISALKFEKEDQTLVIFRSGSQLNLIFKLPFLLDNQLTIESNPYTSPLQSLLQKHPKILLLHLDLKTSTIYSYYLGTISLIKTLSPNIYEVEKEKSRPEKKQQHEQRHLLRYFSDIQNSLKQLIVNNKYSYLVIIGHEKTITKKLINFLPNDLKKKLLANVSLSPIDLADKNTVAKVLEEAVEKYESELEKNSFNLLKEAQGQGRLIAGLRQVISAFNRGLISSFYVSSKLHKKGYICPKLHYIALDRQICRLCNAKMSPVNNIVDELIEQTKKRNIKTIIFSRHPEFMQKFEDISALIYKVT